MRRQRRSARALRPRDWGWPGFILGLALASAGITLADWQSPIRGVVVFAFLVLCPGMGLVRLLGLRDALAELALGVALSIALTTIVASLFMYAGFWSPLAVLLALLAISIGGALTQLRLLSRPASS